jgi:hypothetical protein
MSLKQPEVVTGARGPRDETKVITVDPSNVSDRAQVAGAIPEGEVWFQAQYSRLRVQLTAPQDEKLPDGRVRREAPIVAQFNNAMLRLKKSKPKEARIIELLDEHESKGRLFWNFQDVVDRQEKAEREKAIAVLANPKQRALIVEALKAEGADFSLPVGGKA